MKYYFEINLTEPTFILDKPFPSLKTLSFEDEYHFFMELSSKSFRKEILLENSFHTSCYSKANRKAERENFNNWLNYQ